MNRIGIIGHFGYGLNLSNGQTIKTEIITAEVEKHCGEKAMTIDAHGGMKAVAPVIFGAIKALKNCNNVIVMLTENGLKVCVPVLTVFNRLYKRKLHYVVVGGWLPEFIAHRKLLREELKKFDCIYAETDNMRKALEKMGFSNVVTMPNCKPLHIIDEPYGSGMPYKLCTFSRVMKEKGIEDAVEAVKYINSAKKETVFALDIFGQVDPNQTEWFDQLKKTFPDYVKYCGVVPSDRSTELLKDYFFLLFPTYYYGEGFAGTVIDAFSAGVPVIASKWKYNEEIVHDGFNGLVFEAKSRKRLIEKLEILLANPALRDEMHERCLEDAKQYQPEIVLQTLFDNLA